jgi:hypothetical protein
MKVSPADVGAGMQGLGGRWCLVLTDESRSDFTDFSSDMGIGTWG